MAFLLGAQSINFFHSAGSDRALLFLCGFCQVVRACAGMVFFLAGVDGLEGVRLESVYLYHSWTRGNVWADEYDEKGFDSLCIFFIDKRRKIF